MGKRNGGFSLIETLVSIVILGAMVVPTCTALVMTVKLNDKTEKMLQAQLAVSSAVETLMATGMTGVSHDSEGWHYTDSFEDANVVVIDGQLDVYYDVQVSDVPADGEESLVTVTTTIRAAEPATEGGTGE